MNIIRPAQTTIDLNQAAATYTLFTATYAGIVLEELIFRVSDDAVGGAVTSISIQTNETVPQIFIPTTIGVVDNLTAQNQLTWEGENYIPLGTLIQLTIAGGAAGAARVCTVIAYYKSLTYGGFLI